MSNPLALPRQLLIFGIVLPIALILGYLLADPTDFSAFLFVAVLVGAMSIPIFLRWQHVLLIAAWNSGIIIFFLPGGPQAWMLLALISLGLVGLGSLLNKEQKLVNVPAVTWTLLIFGAIVLLTAKLTGGIGVRSLGSNVQGGKKFYFIFFAIIAYFALSCQKIPKERAQLYTSIFLLGGAILAISNFIYFAGPNFYWLYYFFPADYAVSQALEDIQAPGGATQFNRLTGFTWSGLAAVSFLQMRWGARGLLDLRKPWRLLLWLTIVGISSLGGFRSFIVICVLTFIVQALYERLLFTQTTIYLAVVLVVGTVIVFPFIQKMPMSVQRTLSLVPGLPVHPAAKADAESSTDWRLRMWALLLPEVPKYFWIGKGYSTSLTDYYLAQEALRRGLAEDVELAIMAGDYHNGPLSVLIPFGIFGLLSFIAFLAAGVRLLYRNYRYGDPDLANINVFLLSIFIARTLFFFVFFGAINSDLPLLVGFLGLSVAINGGMAKLPHQRRKEEVLPEARSTPQLITAQ